MLGFEAQQQVQEELRRIDQALEQDLTHEHVIQEQAHNFREAIFSAFQFIENQSLQLQALLVQLQRLGAHQLRVQSKGRMPFILSLDTELAFDTRQTGEGTAQGPLELTARMFVVLAPPNHGLLRHYTIFADGTWKRTTFTFVGGGVQVKSALLQRFSLDILVREAADLLGYVCLLHPTWANLMVSAETLTTDMLQERHRLKDHLTTQMVTRRT